MTRTYATTNIVIDAVTGAIWAQDLSVATPATAPTVFLRRAGRFLDQAHLRLFSAGGEDTPMRQLTEWLFDIGAVVDQCTILGAELSDEERRP